ncbi:hypothetical protein BT69DRAFT_1318207 [Atractiella rhizophila]|nr:hypothetical protein BT69DRAFT_1318207 [Atractiella rhizophila]
MGKSKVLIFFASIEENGKMWCPDCVRVEGIVKREVQHGEEGEEGEGWKIIRVGHKGEWKDKSNYYRKAPFSVPSVPFLLIVPAFEEGTDYDPVEVLTTAPRTEEDGIHDPEVFKAFLANTV